MAVATVDVVHGLYSSGGFVSQITSSRVLSGIEILNGTPAGHPYSLFKAIRQQTPAFEITTTQLATALALTGLPGADLSGGNVDFYLKRTVGNGLRVADATTSHTRYRAANVFLGWDSISADQSGEASINLRAICLWDGSNEPIVPAGSVALAGTPSAAEYFAAGPVAVNGTTINGVQSINIDLQPEYKIVFGDGEVWPTFCYVASINPKITINALDNSWASLGLDGTALTSCAIYLRKLAANGTRVANGTAEHLKFSATNGIAYPESSSGGNNDETPTTLILELASANATAAPLTLSTASAIT